MSALRNREDIAATIRDLIVESWPLRFAPEDLADDASLGEDGLGLDSVEVAELLLTCEDTFDQPASSDLFERLPLTIARVADYFAAA